MSEQPNFIKRFKKILIVTAIGTISFTSISFVEDYFEISKNLDIFTTLYRELNTYYVDEIDPSALMKTGIDAMLESLDPYTNFISESEIEDYRVMTTGQYGGIGARVSTQREYATVVEVYEGFAAFKAGLRAGDIIKEVNGTSTKGKKPDEISKLLKGAPNSKIKVKVLRPGISSVETKEITREKISIKNVIYHGMIKDDFAYIKLTGFTFDAGKEVRSALTDLQKFNPKGIILDLRDNPGGLLSEAVNVSNVFIDKGELVVKTKGRVKEWEESYLTKQTPVDTKTPLIVLINDRSASASEIVSGVIQDLDRGVIIGQKSFGKGLVQATRPLSYNAKLKITTAKYYIPSGRCIQALDYSHRAKDGSVSKVPDSLMATFYTKNKRPVKDGGGIYPDISVEGLEMSIISNVLLDSGLILDFVTDYYLTNPPVSNAKEFEVNEKMYQAFTKFLSSKNYDYSTNTEKMLEAYAEAAKKESYYEAVKDELNKLETKMLNDKKGDLMKFKDELKQIITYHAVGRYHFQSGQIEASFSYDKDLSAALDAFKKPTKFTQILNPN
ncbi:MAG: carboxyl-terminal processing protease [Sphingobacteriales bacterium]|jgi:carboxyl-terminal processing protease